VATILVIEDDTEIRELFAEILTDAGHEVLTAADGAVGLALYERYRPTLVITDLLVPGISGLEIIERLRPDPRVKIIAISGSGVANLEAARRLGAARTFHKPFAIDDLTEVVRQVLAGEPPPA
jgi:DNA-binding response OmpR family regulator